MILLLTLKPAAVWAAEDQKQEETEVPGGKPDTGRPGIKSGGGRGIGTACTFNGSFHGNGTDGKGSG